MGFNDEEEKNNYYQYYLAAERHLQSTCPSPCNPLLRMTSTFQGISVAIIVVALRTEVIHHQ
jgi:hypothetical protein